MQDEIRIDYNKLKTTFQKILSNLNFTETKADACATLFASNSLDGV